LENLIGVSFILFVESAYFLDMDVKY